VMLMVSPVMRHNSAILLPSFRSRQLSGLKQRQQHAESTSERIQQFVGLIKNALLISTIYIPGLLIMKLKWRQFDIDSYAKLRGIDLNFKKLFNFLHISREKFNKNIIKKKTLQTQTFTRQFQQYTNCSFYYCVQCRIRIHRIRNHKNKNQIVQLKEELGVQQPIFTCRY
jgi:hypothetical protein